MKNLLITLLLMLIWVVASAQGGLPDPAFGNNGIVRFDVGLTHTAAQDMALLPDGRILTTGVLIENDIESIILTRFLPDGLIDPTFGTAGKVLLRELYSEFSNKSAWGLAVLPDGKILVGGSLESTKDDLDFMLLRLLPNGSPDASFGTNGLILTDLGGDEIAYDMAVQADDRILLAGNKGSDIAVVRYLPDGNLDTSFGDNGIIEENIPDLHAVYGKAIALQPDGKIVVLGSPYMNEKFAVLRYLKDGTPDPGFGTNGIALINPGADWTYMYALALAPNGTITVGGSGCYGMWDVMETLLLRLLPNGQPDPAFAEGNVLRFDLVSAAFREEGIRAIQIDKTNAINVTGLADEQFFTARFLSDGTPDATFGTDGFKFTTFPETGQEHILRTNVHALALQTDGKMLLAGQVMHNQTLLRYMPDGTLDFTFGNNGFARTPFFGRPSYDKANALAIQSDGKLVVAGDSDIGMPHTSDFSVARFLPNGSPDYGFGVHGRVATDFGSTNDQARAVVVQPDGKIVVGGLTEDFDSDFGLVRYMPNGRPDPTFGNAGMVTTDFFNSGSDKGIEALLLQPDGKILAVGYSLPGVGMARYLPDGTLDPDFGNYGVVVVPLSGLYHSVYAAALQPDGKIVVAASNGDFVVMRFLPDGSLDPFFGTNGQVTTDIGSWNDIAQAVALQPDGKILIAGNTISPSNWIIVRYLPNGTPDIYFGMKGVAMLDFGSDDRVYSLALQADGKIMACGANSEQDMVLVRLLPSGAPDNTFGTDGVVYADAGGLQEGATALVVQPDHQIVMAGYTYHPDTYSDFVLARFKPGVVSAVSGIQGPIEQIELRNNPTSDQALLVFRLQESTDLSVDILGMNGQIVARPAAGTLYPQGESQVALSTAPLRPGVYLVRLQGTAATGTVRLVKVE